MHGLLQTPAYARDLLHLPGGPTDHGATDDDIDRMVAARLCRQITEASTASPLAERTNSPRVVWRGWR